MGENFKHGLFGNFKNYNELINVENLDLENVTKHVKDITKQGANVYKCVISLNVKDAKELGFINKDKWKELIDLKIGDIVKNVKPSIDIKNLEYIGAFHIKEPNMHCHISFWDKTAKKDNIKPRMSYDKIRKELSKEIFSKELTEVYKNKNKYKKEFRSMSKEELKKFKKDFKESLNLSGGNEIEFKFVDTSKEELFIKKQIEELEKMDKNATIYIYDKNDPNNFTELSKKYFKEDTKSYKVEKLGKEKYLANKKYKSGKERFIEIINFKNNGEKGILYKENSISDTACFLKNLSDIKVSKSKNEFQKILNDFNENEDYLDNILKEIHPDIIPQNIYSNVFRKKSLSDISNKIFDLKNTIEQEMREQNKKMNFKYGFYSSDIKKQIDDVSKLILNSSNDCKKEFNKYILNFIEVEKLKGEFILTKEQDRLRVQRMAKDTMYEVMGNQILQFMKENIIENKQEDWIKIKEAKEEAYANKRQEYLAERQANIEFYKGLRQENEMRRLINSISRGIGYYNTSFNARKHSLKKSFANMTKEEIRTKLKLKANSAGFDWFEEE